MVLVVAFRMLSGLGRQARWMLAAGIFLGIVLPDFAAAARPLLGPSIFVLLTVTLVRLDVDAVRATLARPGLLAAAVGWVLIGLPLAAWPFLTAVDGIDAIADELLLTAASAPLISGVFYALLLGLDAAFVLAVGSVATLLVPFTLPILAALLLGIDLPIDPFALWLRMFLLIGGASVIAVLVRGWLGRERMRTQTAPLDGLAVTSLLVFGLAVMDGVTAMALRDPAFVLTCLFGVFGLAAASTLVGAVVFLALGLRGALSMGLLSGFKNFGVVVAAMGDEASPATVVYLGLAQIPHYVLPLATKSLVLRLLRDRRR